MRPVFVLLPALLIPSGAAAHAFESGTGGYEQFVEGVGVILTYPDTLLPLLSLGILISLWQSEGLVRVWPAFLIGQLAGIPLASAVGPWIVPVLQAAGLVVASLGALLNRHIRVEVMVASLVLGALAIAVALEGHGFLELPVAIHLGILFGANMTVALGAGLARMALEQVPAMWMRILWRIAASWLAAILVLMFAFTVSAGG